MFVALFQFFLFGRSSGYFFISNTVFSNRSFHCHHDMVEFAIGNIRSGGPAERLSAHSGSNHFNGKISRTLERRTAAQVDDMLSTLDDTYFQRFPFGQRKAASTDEIGQRFSFYFGGRCKYSHLFSMAAIRAAILNVGSGNVEVFHQLVLQAGAVKGSQCGNL